MNPCPHLLTHCRAARQEHDFGLGPGLRRIRRPAGPARTPTLVGDDHDFVPPSLIHSQTLPISTTSSRSVSAGYLLSGPSSPALEDVHRFPAESLHSFSFARQSEDYLHSRQTILQKSVEFMRDRSVWVNNPALAEAQARVSGNAEIQSMIDLLKKANVLPVDPKESKATGLGLGPMTGPAHSHGRNIFERSFSERLDDSSEEAVLTPLPTPAIPDSRRSEQSTATPMLELRPTSSSDHDRPSKRIGLKRTYTDLTSLSIQQRLIETMAQPYSSDDQSFTTTIGGPPIIPNTIPGQSTTGATSVHAHSSKWAPTAQAVFRTDADAPWTILAANDLACLIFGVTRAEVRSLSILGIIQEDRRQWLEEKLAKPISSVEEAAYQASVRSQANGPKSLLGSRAGITAKLLSKAPSRYSKPSQRAQTDDGSGGYYRATPKNHPPTKSRGVLLCGDIVPIQKRNGTIGSASFWVMEKRGGLIWVVEEINEDVAILSIDEKLNIVSATGRVQTIWGQTFPAGTPINALLPRMPSELSYFDRPSPSGQTPSGHYAVQTPGGLCMPATVSRIGRNELRIASLPHIAGMMVLNPESLTITSSNSVFSAALFGYEQLGGISICTLIPSFADVLSILTNEDDVQLVDGLVVPEHSFRKARALLAFREGNHHAADIFLRPSGLSAKHRDGSDIMVDVQMRVVRSETVFPIPQDAIEEQDEACAEENVAVAELVYAVWITYSRQLHGAGQGVSEIESVQVNRPFTPPSQPEPPTYLPSPPPVISDESGRSADSSQLSLLSPQISATSADEPLEHPPPNTPYIPHEKKTINDFIILEEMGSGAYGQVKLGRYKKARSRKIVLKYVTKKRILVDTWTRDRRLGTVPLEIHVMDYLRRDGLRHPNIVEMIDFFEDDINYYIEMLPHGIPGMDLFDYIELRADMQEAECKSIFRQVVSAIHHLHTVAKVVHRDVKDENVVLDGEGRIKLIDFGSAAYIKNGPFDVFVGTIGESMQSPGSNCSDGWIDYAAPEVLQGKAYGGEQQDIWAMGILLYTIVYKENPFYNIGEHEQGKCMTRSKLTNTRRDPRPPFASALRSLLRRLHRSYSKDARSRC